MFPHLTVLTGLINDVEIILVRVSEFEGVLEEGDGMMIKCGPIGADLDRLVEQQEILDVSGSGRPERLLLITCPKLMFPITGIGWRSYWQEETSRRTGC